MAKKSEKDGLDKASACDDSVCCAGNLHVVFTPREKRLLGARVFRDCELNRIDFSHADLRETLFMSVSLNECDFSGADLRGTSFIACDLRGANFAGATFSRTCFNNSWLINASGLSASTSEYARRNGGLLWLS
jgi:uncharacterized protein YjbI with pentapeptide repeats